MAEKSEQTTQASTEVTADHRNEFLGDILGLALIIGTPLALGWLSEKMGQSPARAPGPRVRHGEPVRDDGDTARPAAVAPVLYERAVRDVTAQDRRGELGEVLWRGREVDQLATLLGGSRPESVLLVGETGIGKTALVEGLVQSIHAGRASDLRRYAVLEFRSDCLYDPQAQAHPEEQAEAFLTALYEVQDDVIAFFDDFGHVAQLGEQFAAYRRVRMRLQQVLRDRQFRCIAAISEDAYRRSMGPESGWQGCFTEVRMEKRPSPEAPFGELDADKTYAILEQRTAEYPARYELEVAPQAIEEAVRLAERRLPVEALPTQRLPGKALTLLEETAKRTRPRWDVPPMELTAVREEIAALEMKQARAADPADEKVAAQIGTLRERQAALKQAWTDLKTTRETLGRQVMRVGWLHRAIESAVLNQADSLADQYREDLKGLQARRHETEDRLDPLLAEFSGLQDRLTAGDVTRVFSELTGIPVSDVGYGEPETLLNLESLLHERVVGQAPAVDAVARALRRARAGVRDEGRPIGNFIFLGPSGVGKTELAKALAETIFGDETAMHRLDMGEYYGPHCVARLVGAPPGYVGYEGGGQLTEAVRRRPHSVILFDEIEKADPKIFDTLLQVLDDGRLTDGMGRTVDFRQALIIMTSNIGSRRILREGVEAARAPVLAALQTDSGFRPEFLNRMDGVIFFDALDEDDLRAIVAMEFAKLRARMRERNGIDLRLGDGAKALIIERGYDPASGAREIQRTMQDLIADRLAPIILGGEVASGDVLEVVREGDGMSVRMNGSERVDGAEAPITGGLTNGG